MLKKLLLFFVVLTMVISTACSAESAKEWDRSYVEYVRNCPAAKRANLSNGQVAKICSMDQSWQAEEMALISVGLVAEAADPLPGDIIVIGGVLAAGKLVKLIVVRAVILAPIAGVLLEPLTPELTKALGLERPFDPSIYDAVSLSMKHSESDAIRKMITSLAVQNGAGFLIRHKGDGPSQGSVRLYAGLTNETVSFAGLLNQSPQNGVKFFVFTTPYRTSSQSPGNGWRGIEDIDGNPVMIKGERVYYNAAELTWKCAWTFSKEIGHDGQPDNEWLNWGQSLAAWRRISKRYNLFYQLAEIPLP